jgi:phosphatidylinositol alpha-mannosyltransferase
VTEYTGIRVVVVAHGPPLKGGITTVAMDLVEDPVLNSRFEMVFLNTSQNEDQRGKVSIANVLRLLTDSAGTFRLARRGSVVHTHSVQEPWPVAWRQVGIAVAARARGARVLLHNHAAAPYMLPPGEYRPGRLNRWAFRVLDRLVDANAILSPNGEPNLSPLMPHTDLPAIANSVVVDEVVPSSADHEPPVVLFIGELLARKGLRTLLDALDLVDGRGSADYELRIIGNDQMWLDPLKDEMIDEVRRRGRGGSMTGPLARSEVYRHFSEADLYVLPTDYEGQPFAVIEALAAGVPVVASRIPSIEAMIDDPTNGRLVERTDTEGFADAIEGLLRDPDERRRISAANRALAAERFDRSVFRREVAELYLRLGTPVTPGRTRRRPRRA